MPQTGPDLVSAGYPISYPLSALLGGNDNSTNPAGPIKTNLNWFGTGALVDQASVAASGAVLSFPVPVTPGDVISKISFPTGATAGVGLTANWAALYTGTGSAPGTAGAQPALIGQTTQGASAPAASTLMTLSFSTPQTITALHAPYGYVYVALSVTGTGAPSLVSMTLASVGVYPWFSTSPVFAAATWGSSASVTAPTSMSVTTRIANPPVGLLY